MERHIACIPTGVQTGRERFPIYRDKPTVKAWRCDLTALSQLYNLYFVACNDTIHVYQPKFPDQSLSSEPELVLNPPVSGQNGSGIDFHDPHSVTRVLVEYLGNEEVLLLTCDDGDVVGYRVEEIQRALDRRIESSNGCLDPVYESDIHVFLHRNEGASAWGLAVHREARIIAISANTHRITIIAYALADTNEDVDTSDTDVPMPLSPNNELVFEFPYSREKDHVFTLAAETNIPALSFNNTGEDPSGRWLFSSSIDGKTILWDLHPRKRAAVFQMGWCRGTKTTTTAPATCLCPGRMNFIHGAWGTIPLDTRAVQEISPEEEAALESDLILPCFTDVSAHKNEFKLPSKPKSSHNGSIDSESDSVSEDDGMEDIEEFEMPLNDLLAYNEAAANGNTQDFLFFLQSQQMRSRRPYCDISIEESYSKNSHPPTPLLIITKEEIFLLQHALANPSQHAQHPIISMRRPLHPKLLEPACSTDRHCFFTQIPELGLFIIASPVGRVGVFSLYCVEDNNLGLRYGFRLEYLLPCEEGDDRKLVEMPTGRAIGVAVGPVQGMFGKRGEEGEEMLQPRRWRVLVYYTDHSVLSFEVAKRRVGGVGVDELVV